MTILAALDVLGDMSGLPDGVRVFIALISKAIQQNRDITPTELLALQIEDADARAALEQAIKGAK